MPAGQHVDGNCELSCPGEAPRRRTRDERVAQSEQALLVAAIKLISEKGYERTTAVEIGEEAGYSRSMVRERYGSKEALLSKLLADEVEQRLLPESVGENATGLQQVLGRIELLRHELASAPERLRAFHVLSYEAVTNNPHLTPWMSGWLERYHDTTTQALIAGQRDGSVRPDIDPASEVRRFMGAGLGIAFRWTIERDDAAYDDDLRRWGERYRRRWQPSR